MFGVPRNDFCEFLKAHYPPGGWTIWCAESRPYEMSVSERLRCFVNAGYETVVIGDNMIAFCIAQQKVHEMFVFYERLTGKHAWCQSGGLLVAVIARELGMICNLYPATVDKEQTAVKNSRCFAGERITPQGAKSYANRREKVGLSYFAQRW